MDTNQKRNALENVADEVSKSHGGPLSAPGVYPVPGEGNPDARVMFIGEAPGFNENEQRRPFVGQAGKLLRRELVKNGWKEDEVYITNIVKYRPPENRDPTPAEIEFFRPFLDKQIDIISPDLIVTLGRYSMYKFLSENVSISRVHGFPRRIDWQGRMITVFPMYHPAAALRAGSVLKEFEADFAKLREFAQGKASGQEVAEAELNKPEIADRSDEQLELI